ncbi:unnamed protein product, partial [Laminaria digitata]
VDRVLTGLEALDQRIPGRLGRLIGAVLHREELDGAGLGGPVCARGDQRIEEVLAVRLDDPEHHVSQGALVGVAARGRQLRLQPLHLGLVEVTASGEDQLDGEVGVRGGKGAGALGG